MANVGICYMLTCRQLSAAELQILSGVVVAAFRGGKTEKRSNKQYLFPKGPLPMEAATCVHVRLLMNESKDGWDLCVATALSPVLSLDPHSNAVLMEITPHNIHFEYKTHCLRVWVTHKSVRAIARLAKANIPFDAKQEKKGETSSKTYFGEEDLARTAAGAKNLQRILGQMKADYQTHCGHLVDAKGMMKLREDVVVSWDEMLCRAPSYFRRYTKGHPYFKSLSAEYQALP